MKLAVRPLTLFCFLFFTLCSLGIHGFSLPEWRKFIDIKGASTERIEQSIGKSQTVRSDDWAVSLPTILSQIKSGFPEKSEVFGYPSHDLVLLSGVGAPTRHFTMIFRPFLWGYFIGGDFGIAWHWWSQIFGLFILSFLLFRKLCDTDNKTAIYFSAFFSLAPFFEIWSFNGAPMVIGAFLSILISLKIFDKHSPKFRIALGLLLFWGIGISAFSIYPPYQIVLILVCLGLVVSRFVNQTLWQDRKLLMHMLLNFCIPLILVLVSLWITFYQKSDVINLNLHTIYPGQRISFGGDQSLGELFSSNFLAHTKAGRWPINICDSARFFLFFPTTLAISVVLKARYQIKFPPWIKINIFLLLLFLAYFLFGLPDFIRNLFLLNHVPGARVIPAIGICDVLLTCWVFRTSKSLSIRKSEARFLLIYNLLFWSYAAYQVHLFGPMIQIWHLILCIAGLTSFSTALLNHNKKIMKTCLFFFVISALWFNPMSRKSYLYLTTNPLASKILETNSKLKDGERWLAVGDYPMANYLRILGVPVLNGTHYYPQFPLWQVIDPHKNSIDTYNRYGYVQFLTERIKESRIFIGAVDHILVSFKEQDTFLRELKVRFLIIPATSIYEFKTGYTLLKTIGQWSIIEKDLSSASNVKPGS